MFEQMIDVKSLWYFSNYNGYIMMISTDVCLYDYLTNILSLYDLKAIDQKWRMGEWTRRNIDMDMLDISFFMEWTCFILILEYGMFMECDMGYFVFLWNMKTLWYFIF